MNQGVRELLMSRANSGPGAKKIKELIVVLVKWLLFLDIVEYFLLHILVNWSKTGKDEKKS